MKEPEETKKWSVKDRALFLDEKYKSIYKKIGHVVSVKSGDIQVDFDCKVIPKFKGKLFVKPKAGHDAVITDYKHIRKVVKAFKESDVDDYLKSLESGKKNDKKKEPTVEVIEKEEEEEEEEDQQPEEKKAEIIEEPKQEEKQEEQKQEEKMPPIDETSINDIDKKETFFELQKFKMQNHSLIVQKTKLEDDLKIVNNELVLIKESYKELQDKLVNKTDDMDNTEPVTNQDNFHSVEKISQLELQLDKAIDQKIKLEQQLSQYSDYEDFKKKFESFSIAKESAEAERDQYKKKFQNQEQEIQALKEQVEIYELEIDLAARGDEIPTDPEELTKNYLLLKSAFNQVDMDLELQKDVYEDKMQQLNNEISNLTKSLQNVLTSDQVKEHVDSKEKELKHCYEIINELNEGSKMIDVLSEKMQKREEEMEKKQKEISQVFEKMKILEEENQILDELNRELEETVDLEYQKSLEMNQANEQLKEQVANLKGSLEKQQLAVENLNFEKQNIQIENSQIQEQKDQFSNLQQEYTKAVSKNQDKIREKMTYKLHGKNAFWEMIKWRMYFEAIPEQFILTLKMEHFDTLKNIFVINDQIDIIQENLILHFLMNKSLQDENVSLYGTSKDLFEQLVLFQNYTTIVREQYLNLKTTQELETFQKSTLYKEVVQNFSLIKDLYEQLRTDDFSSNFCFSTIQESNLALKKEVNFEEHKENNNIYLKFLLNKILQSLVQEYTFMTDENTEKPGVQKAINHLLYANELVFQMKVDRRELDKLLEFKDKLPAAITEFRMWFDNFYKKIDEKILGHLEIQEKIEVGVWKNHITDLKTEISQLDTLKEEIKKLNQDVEAANNKANERVSDLENLQKLKNDQANKIMRLQTKVNEMNTMELKIQEYEQMKKQLHHEIQELKKQASEPQGGAMQRRQSNYGMRGRQESDVDKSNNLQNRMRRQSDIASLLNINKNKKADSTGLQIKTDYTPKVKFEINSLNGVLSNILNELRFYKAKDCEQQLKAFTESTPYFQKLLNKNFKDKFELSTILDTIKFVKSSNFLIKKEISKMKILKKDTPIEEVKNYCKKQNNVKMFYNNAKNMIEETLKLEKKQLDLGFDIDFKKALEEKRNQDLSVIYGKLKLIDSPGQSPKDHRSVNKLSLDVNIK